jgi:hypothetical protein
MKIILTKGREMLMEREDNPYKHEYRWVPAGTEIDFPVGDDFKAKVVAAVYLGYKGLKLVDGIVRMTPDEYDTFRIIMDLPCNIIELARSIE